MRKRRSLRETGSSEDQGVHEECTVDRLSNLPDGVAHKILSLLTFRDLARFGSSSKTCRALYLSTPRLNFRLPKHTSSRREWSRFFSSVYKFLNLRGSNQINHFRIHWSHRPLFCEAPCVCDDVKLRILPWINSALRCQVEVLDIDISVASIERTFEFPSSIFLCGSLKTLSVSKGYATIKTPSSACWFKLQCLNLAHVTLDQGFYRWISSSCKVIKELHLRNVHGEMDIAIESASLKSFSIYSGNFNPRHFKISGEKLENIRMYISTLHNLHCRSLNTFAPNLKNLEMAGCQISNQLRRLLQLEKACIWIRPRVDGGDDSCKALFKEGSMSVPPLEDVSYLRINIGGLFDNLVLASASLLRRTPNLSTLYMSSSLHSDLHRKVECSGYDMEYWKSQNLPFLPHLKEVTIELSENPLGLTELNFQDLSSSMLKI